MTQDEMELEGLQDAANELLEAMATFGALVANCHQDDLVRYFVAYHLADLQGQEAGWMGGPYLVDGVRELLRQVEA